MRGCKYPEWEREKKIFAGEVGEKMGKKRGGKVQRQEWDGHF